MVAGTQNTLKGLKKMDIQYKENYKPSGEAREVAVQVLNEELGLPNQVFMLQFGVMTTKGKDGKNSSAGRWALSRVIIEDGAQVYRTVYSNDPLKMCELQAATVYGALGATPDDYAFDADWEDEFWKQKHVSVKDDVWAMDEFADKLDAFTEARGEIEATLQRAEETGRATQEDYRAVSKKLDELLTECDGNFKLLSSLLMGGEGGSNMPLVQKLGKGVNALREALVLGRMSDTAFEIFPANITSGKGVNGFRLKAIGAVASESYSSKDPAIEFTEYTYGKENDLKAVLPTPESAAAMLRVIAKKFFGIDEALAKADDAWVVGLGDLAAMVDESGLKKAVNFRSLYGKSANTYDKDEQAAAHAAFGALLCTTDGEGLFADAVEKVVEAAEAGDGYAEKMVSATGTRGNALLRAAAANCKSFVDSNAKSREVREALENEAGEEGEAPATIDPNTFVGMDAVEAAAKVYLMLCGHPKAGDVYSKFKDMCAHKEPENRKKVQAA